MRRSGFTLLELVAAIAIIALAVGLAVSTLRSESPIQQLNNAALQFEEFCMRVRFQALENGADRIVAFHPEEKRFFLRVPAEFLPDKTEPSVEETGQETEKLSFRNGNCRNILNSVKVCLMSRSLVKTELWSCSASSPTAELPENGGLNCTSGH